MRQLRKDIQLVAEIATILLALAALITWMTTWPGRAVLVVFGAVGLLTLVANAVFVLVPWLMDRYRPRAGQRSDTSRA